MLWFLLETSTSQNHAYEELTLLPPKQFRDVPSPTISCNKSNDQEVGAIDNILYHIYESTGKNLGECHDDVPGNLCSISMLCFLVWW